MSSVQKSNQERKGASYLIGAQVILGVTYAFTKMGLVLFEPFQLLTFRFLTAFLLITFLGLCGMVHLDLNLLKNRRIMLLVCIYPITYFSCETYGLQLIESSLAGVLLALSPVFTTIYVRFILHEKMSRNHIIAIIMTVGGGVFSSLTKVGNNSWGGILLLLLASVCLAGQGILLKEELSSETIGSIVWITMCAGTIFFGLMSALTFDGSLVEYFEPLFRLKSMGIVCFLSIFSCLLFSFLNFHGLGFVKLSVYVIFSNLSVFVSAFTGWLFLDEPITFQKICGIVFVVSGTCLFMKTKYRGNQ